MPRYGTKIKQRNKSKLRRKVKTLRRYKSRFVGDDRIRALWNHKLTTKQNYEQIGLNVDPNSFQAIRKSIEGAEGALDDEPRLFRVPDSDILNDRNARRPENYMSEEEIKYLRRLIAKHGEDYAAMARDIKTNDMQWTENKLMRRCARLALLDANLIRNRKVSTEEDGEDEESEEEDEEEEDDSE
jgi:nucleolar protein 16